MKKFIIFAPSYSENVGGIICLHKLCSLLNQSGYEAYLHPSMIPDGFDLYSYNLNDADTIANNLNKKSNYNNQNYNQNYNQNSNYNYKLQECMNLLNSGGKRKSMRKSHKKKTRRHRRKSVRRNHRH